MLFFELAVGLLVIYASLCLLALLFQRSLLYFPTPVPARRETPVMSLRDGTLVVMRPQNNAVAILYFGGNAEDVSASLDDLVLAFPDHALYLTHYRGYSGSAGRPTEAALFADALELYDRVCTEHAEIIVIGRSLGSGVAVYLGSRRPVKRLVLVTPYDSIVEVAQSCFPWLPVRWLLRDKYESWRYAPHVNAPVLIVAASQDAVIPLGSTERLRRRFRPDLVTFAEVAGDHNTASETERYWRLLRGGEHGPV